MKIQSTLITTLLTTCLLGSHVVYAQSECEIYNGKNWNKEIYSPPDRYDRQYITDVGFKDGWLVVPVHINGTTVRLAKVTQNQWNTAGRDHKIVISDNWSKTCSCNYVNYETVEELDKAGHKIESKLYHLQDCV